MLELGPRIRALRLERRLTLQAVAEQAGVSQSLISQVERGLASPSINTLRRIAGALGVPIAALFLGGDMSDDESDGAGRRLVVRRHERKGLNIPRSKVVYELLTPDLNRKIEFIWIEYEPGAISHPEPMSHPGEENAVCLEGSVVVTIDQQEFVLTRRRQHLLRQWAASSGGEPRESKGSAGLGDHAACVLKVSVGKTTSLQTGVS